MTLAEKLYELFEPIFLEQLGLVLSDAITLNESKEGYDLKIERLGISMASLSLNLSEDDHLAMANFLGLIGSYDIDS